MVILTDRDSCVIASVCIYVRGVISADNSLFEVLRETHIVVVSWT